MWNMTLGNGDVKIHTLWVRWIVEIEDRNLFCLGACLSRVLLVCSCDRDCLDQELQPCTHHRFGWILRPGPPRRALSREILVHHDRYVQIGALVLNAELLDLPSP
jgi:hypothetical protein